MQSRLEDWHGYGREKQGIEMAGSNSQNARIAATLATVSTLAMATPAFAQGSASGTSATATVVNPADIVVTARKREERLQDVPASLTAFSRDQLRDLGVRDITDISLQTPGFAMQNASRQNEQPFIRGMAVNSVFRQAQNASFFIDGVYVSGVARTVGLEDTERVEVVLGPQAVYFGRATFAGAINYITRRPNLTGYEFDLRSSAGEYGLFDLAGGLSIPIIDDRVAVRVFGQLHNYDGEYRNSLDRRRVGTEVTRGFSASLRIKPTDTLDIVARYQGTTFDDGHSAVALYNPRTNNNCRPNAGGVFQFYCGQLRNPVESDIALNLDQLFSGAGYRRVQQHRFSLLANLSLGDWTLASVTGFNLEKQQLNSDGDATAGRPQNGNLQSLFDSRFTDNYNELRLTSPQASAFKLLVGASLFNSRRVDSSLLFPIVSLSNPRNIRNVSVFGSIGYDITPQLTLTAEGRYQVDRIRVANLNLQSEAKRFLPRATLDFKPTPDLLFYATVAKGNKPADFNTAAGTPVANQATLEETIWNYEIGAKTQFLDRRLTLNATGYVIDWTNQGYQDTVLQRDAAGNLILAAGQPRTVVVTINAGKTRIKGLELDGSFAITPGWTVRLAYSYTDAKFRDFLSRLPITFAGVPQQVAGNQLFNTPRHKLIASTTFRAPVSEKLSVFGSADMTLRGRQFTDELNTAYIGNLTLVNARIGISTDKFEFFLFGRNLTGSAVPDFATRSTDFNTSLNSYLFTLRPGRQFGITASVKLR